MAEMLFTSESVTEGHPDKIADQISDSVLDAMLMEDPKSRVACETLVTTGMAFLAGEVTTKAQVDFQRIVRETIREIGYTDSKMGFDCDTCAVMVSLDKQSPNIKQGVDNDPEKSKEQGAGDQGLMFGYACDETPELMPLPINMSHRLTEKLSQVRKNGTMPELRPDGKSQVTVKYVNGKPVEVTTVVISTQHKEGQDQGQLKKNIIENVIRPVIPIEFLTDTTDFHINPTGIFEIGGPQGDCGLTGRKIIVDTYGGYARHGGGAFSGKDPTKVDRSAAYAARYVAKALVASGLARRAEVQLSYAIGVAKPVSILVESFGTGTVSNEDLTALVQEHFDLRPGAIIENFGLRNLPQARGGRFYQNTAAYGHFGRNDLNLPWEDVAAKAEELRKA